MRRVHPRLCRHATSSWVCSVIQSLRDAHALHQHIGPMLDVNQPCPIQVIAMTILLVIRRQDSFAVCPDPMLRAIVLCRRNSTPAIVNREVLGSQRAQPSAHRHVSHRTPLLVTVRVAVNVLKL